MWAVVCDDIRQEVGKKQSHMGIYTGEIHLPVLPMTMPKLCVVLTVRTLSSDPFGRLVVRILKDDAEFATIEVPEDQLAAINAQVKRSEEEKYISTSFVFQFLSLSIEQPCALRFRAETERETLKGGSTQIKLQTVV
jgi:hypothetical protein